MNFNDVLNVKITDVERPPLVPIGTYRGIVKKIPTVETSQDGKWDFLTFTFGLIGAEDDVDQSDLKAFGGLTPSTAMTRRFIFDREDDSKFKRTLFEVRRFVAEHLMVECDETTELKLALNNTVNQQCLVYIKWRSDKNDPEIQNAEIAKTAPLN